ncbi:MAG TPA: hypothetical protein PKD26_14435 [Pyrinomonadaceae bacterium]|nr:hypothetical protein [Pyrinomonadaceae bacterium]
MAKSQKPLFDEAAARATIEKGRRKKWWARKGGSGRYKYTRPDGRAIKDKEQLERIASLVIPPAWKHVRISPAASSKLQAVGMDATGRVQYIYHPNFTKKREREKFSKLLAFAKKLPELRKLTNEHIVLEGFPRLKVLAIVLRLINSLYFRVGSDKSASLYRTYGITTLKNDHLLFGRNGTLKFDFVGKSHVRHRKVLVDQDMADLMRELKKIGPKRKLFCYLDDNGKPKPVKASEINSYIKSATGPAFSAKDFRTWGASLLAASTLAEIGIAEDPKQVKTNIVKAIKVVAEDLGNTPSVCRSSYVHPSILKAYENGATIANFTPRKKRMVRRIDTRLEPDEAALLRLLEQEDNGAV